VVLLVQKTSSIQLSYFLPECWPVKKWGLNICGFAVVDIVNNTALHLNAWQTPSATELVNKGLNLLTYYASLVIENTVKFKKHQFYHFFICSCLKKFEKEPISNICG
jgi:hypothetical protein